MDKSILEAAGKIKLLVLDVDGVLTDGSIIIDNNGLETKRFHVRDGHGIKMLHRAGVRVAIITGRESNVVLKRAGELGIEDIYQKCRDKAPPYEELLEKYGLSDEEAAYVGDDIVDLALLERSGLSVAVADGAFEARESAMLVTENSGGRGAVREVAELILKARGLWEGIVDSYRQA